MLVFYVSELHNVGHMSKKSKSINNSQIQEAIDILDKIIYQDSDESLQGLISWSVDGSTEVQDQQEETKEFHPDCKKRAKNADWDF